MFKSPNYNNLHPDTLPRLNRGEIAIFKCLYYYIDDSGTPSYPTYIVSGTDVIYDKFLDEYVDIANISSPVVSGQEERIAQIVFDAREKGVLVLRGDNASDVRTYQFLKLSNYNGSNPDRDKSKNPVFMEVNETTKTEGEIKNARRELEILRFATEAPLTDIISYLGSKKVDTMGMSDDKIRATVIKLMKESNVESAPTIETDSNGSLLNKVREMIDTDIIYYDGKSQYFKFRDGDTDLAKVFRMTKDKPAALARELDNNPDLKQKVLELIN